MKLSGFHGFLGFVCSFPIWFPRFPWFPPALGWGTRRHAMSLLAAGGAFRLMRNVSLQRFLVRPPGGASGSAAGVSQKKKHPNGKLAVAPLRLRTAPAERQLETFRLRPSCGVHGRPTCPYAGYAQNVNHPLGKKCRTCNARRFHDE